MKYIINILQICLLYFELVFGPIVAFILRLRGIRRITTVYPGVMFESNHKMLMKVTKILKNATDIKMAFGELDSGVMENTELLQALQEAYANNRASIQIIHGPRTDPRTMRIFDLARTGVVKLFETKHYTPHHFVVVTNVDGTKTVIDETIHNETVWLKNEDIYHRSKLRITYIRQSSTELAKWMESAFEERKAHADATSDFNRDSFYKDEDDLPTKMTILKRAFENLPAWMIWQPLSLLLDKPVGNAYKVKYYDNNRGEIDGITEIRA